MRISAKSDYALRAAVYIAAAGGARVKAEELAGKTSVPRQFLENILGELRRAGIVHAQRGAEGGYALARAACDVTVAQVLSAIGSPLTDTSGETASSGEPIGQVWLALRAAVTSVLESVTLDDLVGKHIKLDLYK